MSRAYLMEINDQFLNVQRIQLSRAFQLSVVRVPFSIIGFEVQIKQGLESNKAECPYRGSTIYCHLHRFLIAGSLPYRYTAAKVSHPFTRHHNFFLYFHS